MGVVVSLADIMCAEETGVKRSRVIRWQMCVRRDRSLLYNPNLIFHRTILTILCCIGHLVNIIEL